MSLLNHDDIFFATERTFRNTPGVHFADIHVLGSNGTDLVTHTGKSVSPPSNAMGVKQWYKHSYQIDYNRCVKGHRLFELYFTEFKHPHWYVFLDEECGALYIPKGCYHRSYSGNDGSMLINHAIRDEGYNEDTEFIPQVIWPQPLAAPRYYGITPERAKIFIETGEYDL